MEFITSKLVVEEVETVILLLDDVFKVVILIYLYHIGLYNGNKEERCSSAKFNW